MKSVFYTFCITAAIITYSCKQNTNTNTGNDATKKVLTKEDSAYNDAIDIHDEVMPKMGQLIGYQKKAQQRIDSITKLIQQKTFSGTRDLKQRADSLLFELKMAQKEMNDWMTGFNADPKLPTAEERTAYFEDQKAKAAKMKKKFFAALDKAKAELGE